MTATPPLPPIREGMQVRSSEGKRLGTIIRVYARESEVGRHLEVCFRVASAFARWQLWGRRSDPLYLPVSAIAEVQGKRVTLNMDTKTAQRYTERPSWLPSTARSDEPYIAHVSGPTGGSG